MTRKIKFVNAFGGYSTCSLAAMFNKRSSGRNNGNGATIWAEKIENIAFYNSFMIVGTENKYSDRTAWSQFFIPVFIEGKTLKKKYNSVICTRCERL